MFSCFPVKLLFPRECDWGAGGQVQAQGTQGAGWGSGQALALTQPARSLAWGLSLCCRTEQNLEEISLDCSPPALVWRGKDGWNELAPICLSPPFPSTGLLHFPDVAPEATWAIGTSPWRCRTGAVSPRTMVPGRKNELGQFLSSFILLQPRGAGSLLRSKSLLHPINKDPSPKGSSLISSLWVSSLQILQDLPRGMEPRSC